ncbi:MAG: T9SS type A sorting domain-containing protein [Bacteroidota bacterium]
MQTNRTFQSLFIALTFCLFPAYGSAQSYEVIRSTLSSAGLSANMSSDNKSLLVHQSVGQGSPIGSHSLSRSVFRQGFLQKPGIKSIRQRTPGQLEAVVYPNPFWNDLTLFIEDQTQLSYSIKIVDMQSRLIEELRIDNQSKIEIQGKDLSAGLYFLHIKAGDLSRTFKIEKL